MSFFLSVSIDSEDFGKPVQLKRVMDTNQSLSLADFKKKTFGGKVAYTYNNRLHIGNVKATTKNAFSTFIEEKFAINKNLQENLSVPFAPFSNP